MVVNLILPYFKVFLAKHTLSIAQLNLNSAPYFWFSASCIKTYK